MKNFTAILTLSLAIVTQGAAFAITPSDYSTVLNTVKQMSKFEKKENFEKLGQYISENYKSCDGYGKKELLEIYNVSKKLYKNLKTKEKLSKVETGSDFVKVYIKETTTAKVDVEPNIENVHGDKIKGLMTANADYAIVFKKEEDGVWRVVSDIVFDERTDIKYGEAIDSPFVIETPEFIKAGDEYTVKTTVVAPPNRVIVGSIGHDRIVFPPEKMPDPYRTIDETGILERIMIANKEGRNEYANSTFAFIVPIKYTDKKTGVEYTKTAISGMGLVVKRVNTEETGRTYKGENL